MRVRRNGSELRRVLARLYALVICQPELIAAGHAALTPRPRVGGCIDDGRYDLLATLEPLFTAPA